jgi:hypothetical protein
MFANLFEHYEFGGYSASFEQALQYFPSLLSVIDSIHSTGTP